MAENEENKEILTEGIEAESNKGKNGKKKKDKKRIKVGHRYIRKDVHDILLRYFDLDDENAVATFKVHFDKLSDVFEIPEDESKSLFLRHEVVDKISDQAEMIPNAYKIKFVIKIDDYEDYDPDEIKQVLYDNLGLMAYNVNRSSRKKTIVSLLLLLVGIIFLVINIWYSSFTKNEEGVWYLIWSEVFDVAAWVFIWEAVTKFFIERNEIRNGALLSGRRFYGLEFIDKEGNSYLEEKVSPEAIEEIIDAQTSDED